MIRIIKSLGFGIAICISLIMFSGCQKNQHEIKQPETTLEVGDVVLEEKADKVTIRTVAQLGGEGLNNTIYSTKLEQFKNENPNIVVEDESAISDEKWKAKIITDFLAGNEPDVIFTFIGSEAKVMINQNKVVPIEEIRKEYPEYASNISKQVLELVKEFDGNTYAVPVKGSYQGLFVNKEIFAQYDLALPTDWEKFETAINVLKENGKIPVAAALGETPDYWIEHLILSQGGVEVHNNKDIETVKSEWEQGLSYFKILYDMGAFPDDTSEIDNNKVFELFNNQEAAMLLESSKSVEWFKEPDKIIVLPIPTLSTGKKGTSDIISSFSAGWYITQKAWDNPAKRRAAMKFIEKMISTDTIKEFVTMGEVASVDFEELDSLPLAITSGFRLQSSAKKLSTPIRSWIKPPVWEVLIRKMPKIITGEEELTVTIDEVVNLSKK